MKIYMGPYRDWIGPYQIADMIFFWLDRYPSDELGERLDYRLHDRFGDWLANDKNGNDSYLTRFCQWIQNHKKRKIKIHINNYDLWGMDHTLALIIHPMLVRLKTQKHGYGFVDDEDVPAGIGIRSSECAKPTGNNIWDDNCERRFDWVMDELIWTFAQLADDDCGESQFFNHSGVDHKAELNIQIGQMKTDRTGLEAHQARVANGLVLFGKYFRTLWD